MCSFEAVFKVTQVISPKIPLHRFVLEDLQDCIVTIHGRKDLQD